MRCNAGARSASQLIRKALTQRSAKRHLAPGNALRAVTLRIMLRRNSKAALASMPGKEQEAQEEGHPVLQQDGSVMGDATLERKISVDTELPRQQGLPRHRVGHVKHGHLRVPGTKFEIRPELVAISMVYLVQGLLGLSRLAVFTFFKDDLQLNPAEVAFLTGLGFAPWVIKPVYGFLSDTVPLFGYRRRSYLILCGILGTVSWGCLASVADSPTSTVAFLMLGSVATACADVVADSIVVELSRGEPQSTAGSLQSLCWGSASAGAILSAYFSGSLVQNYGPRVVFSCTALFPLLVTAAAVVIPEDETYYASSSSSSIGGSQLQLDGLERKRHEVWVAFKAQAKALWGAVTQKAIFVPALFTLLWQATPTADTAMLFFETNELGFTTEFLGQIRLVASVASLIGVGVYNFALKRTPLRKMFFWSAVLGTGLGMTQLVLITGLNKQLGLSNEVFALGDSAMLTVLGQVSFMPVLVLAARICPEGVEATLFATLMSILNGGAFLGSAFGSVLTKWFGVTATNYDNLAPLVLLCTLTTLLPLPLLGMLPKTLDDDEEEKKEG